MEEEDDDEGWEEAENAVEKMNVKDEGDTKRNATATIIYPSLEQFPSIFTLVVHYQSKFITFDFVLAGFLLPDRWQERANLSSLFVYLFSKEEGGITPPPSFFTILWDSWDHFQDF